MAIRLLPLLKQKVSQSILFLLESLSPETLRGMIAIVPSDLTVAVVGATGAVGQEFFRLFEDHAWNIRSLRALASERSAGKRILFANEQVTVEDSATASFTGVDVAFFSAGSSTSKALAHKAVAEGAWVIDNSSAFRMDSTVPLVVPEINLDAITPSHKLIANPNCSTIIMLMAVAPLRQFGAIRSVNVSTYQSASGAGWAAMEELRNQTRDVLDGKPAEPQVLPHPYAFNLFSHNTTIGDDGYNEEERKMILETHKILGDATISVSPTCVRVPVLRAHSESFTVEFADERPSVEAVREALAAFPGVKVVDDRATNTFPMPLDASGIEEVLVGRIRHDVGNPKAIQLFACGDQLLKGAALNAVQIGEGLIARGLI